MTQTRRRQRMVSREEEEGAKRELAPVWST